MRATLERGWAMRTVKVKKGELLEKVEANLVSHVKEYEEAVEGYKEEATKLVRDRKKEVNKELDKLVERISAGSFDLCLPVNLAFPLKTPTSHAKDYKQVIEMLKMSVEEEINLSSDEFACYVMDDWNWKQDFVTTNMAYRK